MLDEDTVAYVQVIGWKEKSIIIGMLVLLFLVLAVPIMQASRHRELTMRLSAVDQELVDLEEQQRYLQARITEAQMPEQTLAIATWKDFILEDVLYDRAKVVVVEELP